MFVIAKTRNEKEQYKYKDKVFGLPEWLIKKNNLPDHGNARLSLIKKTEKAMLFQWNHRHIWLPISKMTFFDELNNKLSDYC